LRGHFEEGKDRRKGKKGRKTERKERNGGDERKYPQNKFVVMPLLLHFIMLQQLNYILVK